MAKVQPLAYWEFRYELVIAPAYSEPSKLMEVVG